MALLRAILIAVFTGRGCTSEDGDEPMDATVRDIIADMGDQPRAAET